MIRNLTAKLVYRPTGVSELFDLVADPRETVNLYESAPHASLRAELLGRLLDHHILTSDVTPTYVDKRSPPQYPHVVPLNDPWAVPGAVGVEAREAAPASEDLLAINGVVQE